jgi:GNAT superfamily N-acetyltransferase
VEFRVVGPGDVRALADIFSDIDETFFRPHPFTEGEALRIAALVGKDVYAILLDEQRPIAYGMLRGFDEGYTTPSLGIVVRTASRGRGFGRLMMAHLHAEARTRGAVQVRLRVHRDNIRARRLYESLGYEYMGDERGELVMLLDLQGGLGSDPRLGTTTGAMKARLLAVDAPEWASFLRGTPHDFYHLPAYVALCAIQERGEAQALYVEDGERSMLLPLIFRSIPGGDGRDATSPYGYPGPLVSGTDDPGFLSDALLAGIAALRAVGIVSVFVRFHPLLNASPPEGVGEVVLHGATVSVDLTLPGTTLWAQMRHNHRRDITKAVKSGLVARMDPGFKGYDKFKRLYRTTMDRHSASPYYLFGDEYFDGLRDALGEQLQLCLVERDDVVAGAGLFIETCGIVQYHLGGSDESSVSVQPSKLMLYFACGWAKERGNRYLHLGGGVGGANDSLLHFKGGFSPLRHPFRTLRIVIDEAAYRNLASSHDRSLNPKVSAGYFPEYRAE